MIEQSWNRVLAAALVMLAPAGAGLAQAAAPDAPSGFRADLPDWLEIQPEIRFRTEHRRGNGFEIDVENALATRLFLGVGIRPHRRFRVFVQGMDARMPTIRRERLTERYRDVFDIREAYVELGDAKTDVWKLIAGRQLFVYGSERVIGQINWSNSRRAFDAVRVRREDERARIDVFTGSVVNDFSDTPDRSDYGNGFHGAYTTWKKWIPRAEVDAYLLYRTRRRATDELGRVGDGDLLAPGLRVAGKAGAGLDYEGEVVVERGELGQSDVSAWSGAVEAGWRFSDWAATPRVYGLYQYAAGDSDPNDGRIGTYDQLYASNHRHRGLADLIGYRNLNNWGVGVEGKAGSALTLKFEADSYVLANRHDGYYTFNGRRALAPVEGGAKATRIGWEYDFSGSYKVSATTTISAGFGRFVRGGLLKRYSQIRSSNFGYVMVEFKP